jgi:tRNA/rRNA methyltransferase
MNCRVVLVRTEVAANIGATARVMRNFGLDQLILVGPAADPRDLHARALATHGEDILDRCRVVSDFAEAVGACALVAATSARTGGLFRRQTVGPPHEILPILARAQTSGPVALVFGPERTGLTNEEVSRCTYLVNIPTVPECPALNLAQAVAICLYEMSRSVIPGSGAEVSEDVAPYAEQERMFSTLRESLERIEYLYGPKADALMHGLRHLIGRARPSRMEVGLLTGLARQIDWVASRRSEASDRRASD